MFNYGNNKKPISNNFTPFLQKGVYTNVVVTKVVAKRHKLAPETKVSITIDVGGGELFLRMLSDARRYDVLEFSHISKQVLNVEVLGDGDAEHAVNTLPGTVWDIEFDDGGCLWTLVQSPTSDGEEEAA